MQHDYSKKDFKRYKQQCKYWLNKFGITEYEVDFKHRQLDDGIAALTTYNTRARLACFSLSHSTVGDYCVQDDVDKLALHEVIHLLLAEFGAVVQEAGDSDLSVMAEHAVVMRLVRAFTETKDKPIYQFNEMGYPEIVEAK